MTRCIAAGKYHTVSNLKNEPGRSGHRATRLVCPENFSTIFRSPPVEIPVFQTALCTGMNADYLLIFVVLLLLTRAFLVHGADAIL